MSSQSIHKSTSGSAFQSNTISEAQQTSLDSLGGTQKDIESTLNRQSVAPNKVAISTSTTTLGSGQYDEGFKIPETKAKRAGRGRGKKSDTSGETKTTTSSRNRSRGPAIEIDFTDDEDYSLLRNNSGTQLERDRETESLN